MWGPAIGDVIMNCRKFPYSYHNTKQIELLSILYFGINQREKNEVCS